MSLTALAAISAAPIRADAFCSILFRMTAYLDVVDSVGLLVGREDGEIVGFEEGLGVGRLVLTKLAGTGEDVGCPVGWLVGTLIG